MASKEVIISAGALDSPKLLLLSGIGPKDELSAYGISCLHHLPGVGKNLQDRTHVPLVARIADGSQGTELFKDNVKIAAAREELDSRGSGPFTEAFNSFGMNYLPADDQLISTAEFAALPAESQTWIRAPTIPVSEWYIGGPSFRDFRSYLTTFVMLLVPQSRGAVTLSSADPTAPPVCDPNYYGNAFDRVNHIQNLRKAVQFFETSPLLEKIVERTNMPRSTSDEDLWAFIQDSAGSVYHMTGTLKMGRSDDEMAVVDARFRVRGLDGLRVADMSVVPFLPNCHTQAPAYLTGETLAEMLTAEYELN